MKKHPLLFFIAFILSGCFTGPQNFPEIKFPGFWGKADEKNIKDQKIEMVDVKALRGWWKRFGDSALNQLIDLAMTDSPDRKIALARVFEARGLRRSVRSSLFPQIGLAADVGREEDVQGNVDNFYDAGFDASYELDIFGVNRKAVDAADAEIEALEAEYQDVTLTLMADIARSYITYRAAQKQSAIARRNLDIQEKTLELIRQQYEFGEAPQLDVERSENLVNTTRASIPEFERLADNARLQLTVLTGILPQELLPILSAPADIPGQSLSPVLMVPAEVIALRPDIRAASRTLAATTSLAESATAQLFPTFTLSGFFNITENALSSATSVWSVGIGAAVALLDFGRIEGQIDAARALEFQVFQAYRKTILEAVGELETALADYARINTQRVSLQKALANAQNAFTLSETLYREGEISFLDVLDAQRTVNEADSAVVAAEASQSESLVRLYKALGVY